MQSPVPRGFESCRCHFPFSLLSPPQHLLSIIRSFKLYITPALTSDIGSEALFPLPTMTVVGSGNGASVPVSGKHENVHVWGNNYEEGGRG